ncbi:hypothetical protein CC2G_002301 [Coprinopsis cinerea AmutBmut pab1-1]|nr:hypothetical protein CC2G_002301 [Coprinopsis cinerea AmutBmut pab1-1]
MREAISDQQNALDSQHNGLLIQVTSWLTVTLTSRRRKAHALLDDLHASCHRASIIDGTISLPLSTPLDLAVMNRSMDLPDDDSDGDDTAPADTSLCVICKARPRHSTYETCGTTCGKVLKTKCTVCRVKPRYQNNGKTYPTCGMRCAAALQSASLPASPIESQSPRSSRTARGGGNSNLCSHCGQRPKVVKADGTTFPHCGLRCRDAAAQMQARPQAVPRSQAQLPGSRNPILDINSLITTLGGLGGLGGLFHPAAPDRVRPDDPATPPPAVSPSLRRRATMATMNGAGSRLSVGSPQPRLGSFPRPPHTWKDMKSQGAKNAPVLLEIPKTEDAFEKVYDLFRGDWKTPGRPKVTVHRIFIVYQSQDIIARHEQFKQQLCSDSEGPVRESRRWIGVGHTCMLLKSGFVTPCTSLRCTLCDVVRRNVYSPVDFPRMIPATGTSNKADKLAFPVASTEVTHKAMLLTKVVSSDEEKNDCR